MAKFIVLTRAQQRYFIESTMWYMEEGKPYEKAERLAWADTKRRYRSLKRVAFGKFIRVSPEWGK